MEQTTEKKPFQKIIFVIKDNSLLILLFQAFLFGLVFSINDTIFQPFILSIIPSLIVVGFLQSLSRFGSFSFQIVGGYLSDLLGRKKGLLIGFFLLVLMGVGFFFLAIQPLDFWGSIIFLTLTTVILSAGMAFYRSSSPAAAIDSSESKDESSSQIHLRNTGLILSFLLFVEFGSGIFGPLIAGLSIEQVGFQFAYLIVLVICILGFLLILFFYKDKTTNNFFKYQKRSLKSYFKIRPALRTYYIATSIDSIGWTFFLGIWYSLLMTFHGYTISQLALLSVVFNLVLGVGQLPSGWLSDKFKKKYLFGASQILGLTALGIFFLSQEFYSVALGNIFFALSVSLWLPSVYSFLGEEVPKEERAFEIGKWNAFRGIITLPIPFIAALIAESSGFHAPLIIAIIIVALASIFYLRIQSK